MILTG